MENYEGDYRCQGNEGPEDPCHRVAEQCYREPYTPSSTPVILCNDCAEWAKAAGYYLDAQATAQLCRDIEREAERLAELEAV